MPPSEVSNQLVLPFGVALLAPSMRGRCPALILLLRHGGGVVVARVIVGAVVPALEMWVVSESVNSQRIV